MKKSPLPKSEMNNRAAIALWLYLFAHGEVGTGTIWTVYRGVINGQYVIKKRLQSRNKVKVEYVQTTD